MHLPAHFSSCLATQVPAEVALLPTELWATPVRRTALCDFLTRAFGTAIASAGADARAQSGSWHDKVSGSEFSMDESSFGKVT